MSAEFDPNKRSREPLSPEMLELQRARAEARKRTAEAPKPPVTDKRAPEIPKMEVDYGSEHPEEGKRVRVKISDEERESHRQLIEQGKQKAQEKKTAEIKSKMDASAAPQPPAAAPAPATPVRKSLWSRLFG